MDRSAHKNLMRTNQKSFVEHFDQVVQSAPRRVAIESGNESVTYEQLQQSSNEVAGRLRPLVGGPGDVVGLHLEKSANFLSAAIACWRLRCAWVPIAPTLPPARQKFVLDDCNPNVVLTDNLSEKRFVFLGDDLGGKVLASAEVQQWLPGDLAYVIYTSGTTGVPSGVEVTHRGIMNLLEAQVSAFQLDSDSRSVWYYSPSFDASVSDWGTTLYAGGTLLIERKLGEFSPQELIQWLKEKRVSHADLPPSLLQLLPETEMNTSLHTIVIGGQATDPETIHRWGSKVRLVNVYGPTEATVCTSLNVCEPGETRALIGQPISDVTYQVVDSDLEPVQPGAEGELLISGPCLARGYRNQPEKTRKQFVDFKGRRSYRSGDRVRQDADGNFVFCGRIDRQISWNGLRIEPAEIESAIVAHPRVTAAAVLLRKISARSAKPRMVAFIETQDNISAEEIRSHLDDAIPSAWLPHWFEFSPALPRTASGKVDLPTLESCSIRPLDSNQSTEGLQGVVLALFGEATGESHCGPDIRWKDWGADSLSTMHLVALAAKRGLDLPLWLLSQNPSPRQVVEFLENGHSDIDVHFPYACPVELLREDAKRVWRDIQVSNAENLTVSSNGGDILLTGATGFLGARVLVELLRRSSSRIVCLVRSEGQSGKERLQEHLRQQELEVCGDLEQRIVIQPGDVANPTLGMSKSEYGSLLGKVGAVVHCAADINALASYEELRKTNVTGTANLLEFSRRAHARMHHASTLSVFVGTDRHEGLFNEDSELSARFAYGGYAQSKLAAEFLLREASPLPATTHRFGLLVADRRSKVYPPNDILTSAIGGLLKVGCAPRTSQDLCFDMTPVDYAGAAMAATVTAQLREPDSRKVLHLAGRTTMTFNQLIEYLRGYVEIEEVSTETFWGRIEEAEGRGVLGRLEAATLRASFSRWLMGIDTSRELDLFQSTGTIFDCQRTGEFVESLGIEWPEPTIELVDRVLSRICVETVRRQR